jgi:hypothetical protein
VDRRFRDHLRLRSLDLKLQLSVVGALLVACLAFDIGLLPVTRLVFDDTGGAAIFPSVVYPGQRATLRWSFLPEYADGKLLLNGDATASSGSVGLDEMPQVVVFSLADRPADDWSLRFVELRFYENASFWLFLAGVLCLGMSFWPAAVQRLRNLRWPKWAAWIALLPALALFAFQVVNAPVWRANHRDWAGQHYFVASNLVSHGIYGWTIEEIESYGWFVGPDWDVKDRQQIMPQAWTYPAYTVLIAGVVAVDHALGIRDAKEQRVHIWAFDMLLIALGVVAIFFTLTRLQFAPLVAGLVVALFVRTGLPGGNGFHITSEPLLFLVFGVSLWVWAGYALANRALTMRAVLLLAVCAGIGQLSKPYAGALIPVLAFVDLALREWRLRRRIRQSDVAPAEAGENRRLLQAVTAFAIIAIFPTLVWAARNYVELGSPVMTSTNAGWFVAQSLSPTFVGPPTLGRNEVENNDLTLRRVPAMVADILFDRGKQVALLSSKWDFFVPSLTGVNMLPNPRWMSPHQSTLATLPLVSLFLGACVAGMFLARRHREVVVLWCACLLAWWAFHLLTQPLPRYFTAPAGLYILVLGLLFLGWRDAVLTATMRTAFVVSFVVVSLGVAVLLWNMHVALSMVPPIL